MDPATFHSLQCRLEDATFSKDKLSVLNSSQGYFNGHQLARVLEVFMHDNDKLKALQAIQGRLYPMTCVEAAQVLKTSPFSNTQLKILEIIGRYINDVTTGGHLVQEVFDFGHDKNKAMEILNRCSGTGGGYPAGAPASYPSAPPTTRPAAPFASVPGLGGMMKGMGAAMGAAMGATVKAMGAGFNRGKADPGDPPPTTGTYPGTYPGQTTTAYPGQAPPGGPGYPPAPGAGYPPAPGTGYPPAPGSGYPPAPGTGYPPPGGPGYPPAPGSGYPRPGQGYPH